MKDKLEDFIRSNREAFDSREPKKGTWETIEGELTFRESKSVLNSLWLWRAAAVLFLSLSVYLLVSRNSERAESRISMSEFKEVEAYYTQEIYQKVKLIEEFSEGSQENELSEDFHQLDAMYQVLKEEMRTRPSKKVKDALVLNLMVRINLLNKQLQDLEKDDKISTEEKSPEARS